MIYKPYRTARYVPYSFPDFTLNGPIPNTVDSCKYLGHIISATDDDNPDIVRQMGLLCARTNMLIRKFSKCGIDVKLCLFRAYCSQFLQRGRIVCNAKRCNSYDNSARPSDCPSVRLSVTRWYCTQTNEDRITRSSL